MSKNILNVIRANMTGVSPTTLTYDLLQEYPYSVITSYVVKESVYKQEWDV